MGRSRSYYLDKKKLENRPKIKFCVCTIRLSCLVIFGGARGAGTRVVMLACGMSVGLYNVMYSVCTLLKVVI